MKLCLILFFFLSAFKCFSQELNYCDYFTLGVSEREYEGKMAKSCWPVTLKSKDKFTKFLNKHGDRFDYILFREHESFNEISEFYPDSVKIKNAYCDKVIATPKIQDYFRSLTPNDLITWQKTDTFSVDELMITASRYFYCDGIEPSDTTIQWHICVGINGQNEYKSDRDLTLLEAFSIEVIMHYLSKNKDPQFFREFDAYSDKITEEKITDFKDFESYLLEIRNLCYLEMQNNTDLKEKLLKYYKKNKSNLNFVIKS